MSKRLFHDSKSINSTESFIERCFHLYEVYLADIGIKYPNYDQIMAVLKMELINHIKRIDYNDIEDMSNKHLICIDDKYNDDLDTSIKIDGLTLGKPYKEILIKDIGGHNFVTIIDDNCILNEYNILRFDIKHK